MATNYKGLLQEYCQKCGENLPEYHISSFKPAINNAKGLTMFYCSVRTFFGKFTIIDGYELNKKSAQQKAAKKAWKNRKNEEYVIDPENNTHPGQPGQPDVQKKPKMDMVQSNDNTNTTNTTNTSNTSNALVCRTCNNECVLVLIDLENCPKVDTPQFLSTKFENVKFISCYGKCSSQAKISNLEAKIPFSSLHKVNFARSDGVDHYISVLAGYLLSNNSYEHIIILSSDKFASSTADSLMQIAQNLPDNPLKKVHHVSTADECYELLMSYCQVETK